MAFIQHGDGIFPIVLFGCILQTFYFLCHNI